MRLQYVAISVCVVVGAACAGSEAPSTEPPSTEAPSTGASSFEATVATTEVNASKVGVPTPATVSEALVDGGTPTRKSVHKVVYTDVTDAERTVVVEVRRPSANAAMQPVVVWSHGGSDGKKTPTRVGNEWGQAMNQVDFGFVAVAHTGRTNESVRTLCKELEVEVCEEFKHLLWDRLRDIQTVFDWLEQSAASGELPVDLNRLVYGGHSAGAMAVMVMAGMDSPYATGVPMPTDDRPAAFLVASPPGADKNGLEASSFLALDRPMLLLTGQGDTTRGNRGPDRLGLFDLIGSEQVMLVSTDSEFVGHTTFDLNTQPCIRAGGTQSVCRDMVRAFGHTAQTFLQASLSADGLDPERLITEVSTRLPDHTNLRGTTNP